MAKLKYSLLLIAFSLSFISCCQSETIFLSFKENGYVFQVDNENVFNTFSFPTDSLEYYEQEFSEKLTLKSVYGSTESIDFHGYIFDLRLLLILTVEDKGILKITEESTNKSIRFKVKEEVTRDRNAGIGGSSRTELRVVNKKGRKVIFTCVIARSLAC